MNLKINGQEKKFDRSNKLMDLLNELKVNQDSLVIEYNGIVLKRVEWLNIELKDNDVLELVSFVGGG